MKVLYSRSHHAHVSFIPYHIFLRCLFRPRVVLFPFLSFLPPIPPCKRFHPVMHSPHRASFKHEEDEVPPEVSEDGSGRLVGGAFLVDEMFNQLKPGLKNKAMWRR